MFPIHLLFFPSHVCFIIYKHGPSLTSLGEADTQYRGAHGKAIWEEMNTH